MKDIYTVFDNMQENFNEVNEISLSEVDVDKQRIKEGIFSELGLKNKKKHFGKRLAVTLIAASLAVAVLGTTAVASGSFNSVFGQLVAGEAVAGVYSGGNVKTNSDTLNIDFKGVTGDDRQVCAMMTITKKDGTPFADDMENTFINKYSYHESKLSCTKPFWQKVANRFFETERGNVWYDLVDNKTINATVWYNDDDYSLIGETLSVSDNKVYLCHVEKELSTWEEFLKSLDNQDDDYEELKNNQVRTIVDGKMVTLTLKDNETITCYKDKQVLATYEEIDLKYNLSVQLNYRKKEKVFDELKNKTIVCDGVSKNIRTLAVQPYTMQIDLYQSGDFRVLDNDDYHTQAHFAPDTSELDRLMITATDGQIYYANKLSVTSSGGENGFEETILYQFTDTAIDKIAVIDPDKIVSISCNGKYIYQA